MENLNIRVEKLLSQVEHPAKDASITSLNLVQDIRVEDKDGEVAKIKLRLVFPSPDPMSGSIKKECEELLAKEFPNAKISILELVTERNVSNKKLELGQEQIANVGKIIAVASGKGGVGKSTVAVNLALALADMGYKVGLADADVYGPSVPKMTGTEGDTPKVELEIDEDNRDTNGNPVERELIVPIEKYGVKWMSIGYFASPEQALIWRGPMACNALKQMIFQVKWGELDFLLIDLPPGTGDIHISLVHDTPLSSAIIVSTPQAVALADVLKGVNMFRNKDINVPILGLVENMAWFTPAELPENKYYIFGKEGGAKMADQLGIDLLAQVPIYMSIREHGDEGTPGRLEVWEELAKKVASK